VGSRNQLLWLHHKEFYLLFFTRDKRFTQHLISQS
jgi:hypothetical protein